MSSVLPDEARQLCINEFSGEAVERSRLDEEESSSSPSECRSRTTINRFVAGASPNTTPDKAGTSRGITSPPPLDCVETADTRHQGDSEVAEDADSIASGDNSALDRKGLSGTNELIHGMPGSP